MRRRWKAGAAFWPVLFFIWAVGGVFAGLAVQALLGPCTPHAIAQIDRGCGLESSNVAPELLTTAIWYGPVATAALVVGVVWLARLLWDHRPRRVWEPVQTDLRARSDD